MAKNISEVLNKIKCMDSVNIIYRMDKLFIVIGKIINYKDKSDYYNLL